MDFIRMACTSLPAACTFNPNTRRQRPVDLYEYKASLIYAVSSRTARAVT